MMEDRENKNVKVKNCINQTKAENYNFPKGIICI